MALLDGLRKAKTTARLTPDGTSLSDLPPECVACIAGFDESISPDLCRRLCHLGFRPGTHVEVVRRAPFGGPVVARLANYEICLRKEQAAAIRVTAPALTPGA